MKRLLYLILFLIQSLIVYGQRSYYLTDSLMSVGVRVIDGGAIKNSTQCQIVIKGKTLIYSPEVVKEYGFKDGRVYISRIIKINNEEKKVFLQRLSKGNMNLYYYKDKNGGKFFIEKDSGQLVEVFKKGIDNSNYRDFLKPYTQDCNNVSGALKLVTYNKPSLTKFIDQYNSCLRKPFPFFKYGILIGSGMDKLILRSDFGNEYFNNFKYKYERGKVLGCFIDKPFNSRVFSVRAEFIYSQNGFSYNYSDGNKNKDMDIVINTTSLNFPILVRYTYPSLGFCPFINIGGVYALNFKNQSAFYEANTLGNTIEIRKNETALISQHLFGPSLGGGFQFNLDYRRSMFIEFRFTKLFSSSNSASFNKNQLQLLTGINF